MPSWTEFRLACRGVTLLARFDADFLRYFDRSATGALRSFWLALFLLPFELLSTYLLLRPLPGIERFLAADVVGYAFGWILFPMVLLTLERPLEREREVPGCIAILNWMQLLPVLLQVPALFAAVAGASLDLINGLLLIVILFVAAVQSFMFMKVLRIPLWQGIGLSIIETLLNIALGHLVFALGYTPGTAIS